MLLENIKKLKLNRRNTDRKKSLKDYIVRVFILIVSLFLINFLVDVIFKVNMMNIVTTKILNSLGIYTEEVKNIEIESSDYSSKGGGSWHIDKSAMWTGRDTAKVTFNLNTVLKRDNYKDIILVIDISGSMIGEKIEKAKSDAIELVNYVLSDSNNRIALITFDDTSEVLSELTNDKDNLINKINSLTDRGCTNYNSALKNVDIVMDGYKKETNRDVVTLFLTDGYPNEETPNQIGTYAILKDKYPYMSINGVQYEMGTDIIEEIKEITDYQYVADTSTLNNVLFEASVAPEVYEKFEIVDYINNDYFYLESVNDIEVSRGEVRLEEENGVQKITWNLGDNSFLTGGSATMSIDLKLKDEYSETGGYYPTNNKESVTYKLSEESIVNSDKTPVLKNSYNVIYDTNPPAECSSIKKVSEEEHFVYENVTKRSDRLTCEGWQFKGWEVVENVVKVNDEVFVMPESDVNIRGTWTKQSISKSMDGTVYVAPILYNVVKNDAENNNGAVLYTGNGSDTFANDVYYYNGDASITNNNVIFANFCWKIVRTTETGGVKIVYNGVPTDGMCNNTGTDSQIGTSAFNSSYNSPAYVGYMYNATSASNYSYKRKSYNTLNVLNRSSVTSTNYYYGDKIEYNETTKQYVISNSDGSAVSQKVWSSNYSTLTGYYTCRSTTATACSTVYYVAAGTNSNQYTVTLTGGKSLGDVNTMTLGSSITENTDGTYTLNNSVTITKSDWYENYNTYKNYYICSDQVSTTCSDMYSIAPSGNYYYHYWSSVSNKYLYGNSFTYEDGTYKLTNTDTKEIWDLNVNYKQINNNHYTCFNETGECTTLSYVYYASSSSTYYINLVGGKNVEDALNEMLWDDNVNDKDSTIKEAIDKWYVANMMEYTDKLEDTVFCNDRSIFQLNGWVPDGGDVTKDLFFGSYGRKYTGKYDLTCPNKNDRFTTSTSNGNGKLTYPVGLLTADEVRLIGTSQRTTEQWYWLGSPFDFDSDGADGFGVDYIGNLNYYYVYRTNDVRPVVSLKLGTMYSEGDGSFSSPFIIFTD